MLVDKQKIISLGLSVLEIEANAIQELAHTLDERFAEVCLAFLKCEGRVIVTGIGKSGHIGKKIAATLASTGTPSFFLHPAEASHGDLGMITPKDVVFALSYSGETSEILTLLPIIKRSGVKIYSCTNSSASSLAQCSDIHLPVSISKEACPLGLAPTASTTALLAMGDAIAIAILETRGFSVEDFAKSHPGGRLGRRLLLKIEDIMHTGNAIPKVNSEALLVDALMEMTEKRLGFTAVVDRNDSAHLIGIFTDGDLRRTLSSGLDIHLTPIKAVMNANARSIEASLLAVEALSQMEKEKILVLPVVDKDKKLIGALNMHDLFKAGLL